MRRLTEADFSTVGCSEVRPGSTSGLCPGDIRFYAAVQDRRRDQPGVVENFRHRHTDIALSARLAARPFILGFLAMISSMSLSNLATIRPPREGGGTYIGDLGSKTFENFRLSGQKEMTESERGSVLEEIRPVIMALHGFKMAGISDPLAAAREAVKGTQQRQFDTRNAALGDAGIEKPISNQPLQTRRD